MDDPQLDEVRRRVRATVTANGAIVAGIDRARAQLEEARELGPDPITDLVFTTIENLQAISEQMVRQSDTLALVVDAMVVLSARVTALGQ